MEKVTYRRYVWRQAPFGWAIFVVGSDGFFSAVSDYGNYSYLWRDHACDDFREFLLRAKRDSDYFIRCLRPKRIYDPDATERRIKEAICRERRSRSLSKEDARTAWNEITDAEIGFGYDLYTEVDFTRWYDNSVGASKLYDPSDMYATMNDPMVVRFVKEAMVGLAEIIQKEFDAEHKHVLIEPLAEYAHEAWSGWMKYLFGKSLTMMGGGVCIPVDLVSRWTRQMSTPYDDLSEEEKDSDRKEARRILAIVHHPVCSNATVPTIERFKMTELVMTQERDRLNSKIAQLEGDIDDQRWKAECTKAKTELRAREQEVEHLKSRLRNTAQILIEEIGADGPMDAEDAALKAVGHIAELKQDKKSWHRAFDDIRELATEVQHHNQEPRAGSRSEGRGTDMPFCEKCKNFTFSLQEHRCPPWWLVWNPEENDTVKDATRVRAYGAEEAAIAWAAARVDEDEANYLIATSQHTPTVCVVRENDKEATPERWSLDGEMRPTYYAHKEGG